MKDILIGIDAGTSVIKSIAFDLDGKQIGEFAIPNDYQTVGAGAEQDMARTWADTAATLRGLADKITNLAPRTAAIAVTGQGDGTWLIDGAGQPTHPALLWLDARAASIAEEIASTPGDMKRFADTGTGLNACQQGTQLVWLKRNRPEVFNTTSHALHCKDWLYFNLTGEIATDPSEGIFTFGNFRTRTYSDDVIDILGLTHNKSLLPPMMEGTELSGGLSQSAADHTGLLTGTPVVLGYVDVVCSALGAGLYDIEREPGVTIVGSTGMHIQFVRNAQEASLNDDRTGYTMCMPVPGSVAQIQSNMASTLNIDWLLAIATQILTSQGIDRSTKDLISHLDAWVESARPGGLIFQPFISEAGERGPFINADARASFIGLSTEHSFADMMRAVFEGLAFAARDCYGAMASIPSEIRITGGAARSQVLRKIFGSAVGAHLRTSSREEAGAAGAAMMAAVCIGHYDTMQECADQWVSPFLGELEAPDAALSEIYGGAFKAYQQANHALPLVWQTLADNRSTQR